MHTADAFILRIDFLCHIIARAMATSKLSLDHMMVTWLKRNNQESVVIFFFLVLGSEPTYGIIPYQIECIHPENMTNHKPGLTPVHQI